MNLSGKKVLVIGGAGFIGSHTVEALLQTDVAEVCVFDNFSRGTRENLAEALKDRRVTIFPHGGEITQRDLLEQAMQGVDGVFLFAALWLLHCHDYPRSAFEVNVAGTFNVLEAVLRAGVKRVVFSSSASVYGDAVVEPMTEEHPFNNTTFYGATKIAGEQMFRALHHRYRATDRRFEYVGLRYMNVYGPRQDDKGAYTSVVMRTLSRLGQGLPPVIHGDGSQAYDFVYVEDCARANVLAMEASATDEYYNVGTGVRTTIKSLAESLLRAAGSDMTVQYEPAAVTFVKNRVGSTAKAEAHLQFRATVGLQEGLRRTLQWYQGGANQPAPARKQAATVAS